MDNATYPPIPPNCESFFNDGDKDLFETSCCDDYGDIYWTLDGTNESTGSYCNQIQMHRSRPIIAAVARCAWIDESRRIWASIDVNRQTRAESGALCDARDIASGNAESWRVWGLQK